MESRPVKHLNAASKLYPQAWKQVDMFRASKGDDLPDWPDWCFLPFAAWYAITSGGGSLSPDQAGDIAKLAAIGTWRYTQGIYRFDRDVYDSLINTDFDREMPVEVLYRLKEWCIYVETPDLSEMYGFFAHLEHDINTGIDELMLLIDCEESLIPIILHIGDWTVERAIDESIKTAIDNQERFKTFGFAGKAIIKDQRDRLVNLQSKIAKHCLSLLLYLCSDEPDIERVENELPHYIKPTRTKRGLQFFPPSKPKIWNIGRTIGEQIRKWQKEPTGNNHASPKAHIRRAHWHGYWTGSKAKANRKFIYKWIAPIFVNTQA